MRLCGDEVANRVANVCSRYYGQWKERGCCFGLPDGSGFLAGVFIIFVYGERGGGIFRRFWSLFVCFFTSRQEKSVRGDMFFVVFVYSFSIAVPYYFCGLHM